MARPVSLHRQRHEAFNVSNYNEDRRIDQLDQAAALTGNEDLPLFQDGNTVQAGLDAVAAWIGQGVPNPPSLPAHAVAYRTTSYTPGGSGAAIPYQASKGTMASLWNISNPTRLTVPAGTTYIRLSGQARYGYSAYNNNWGLRARHNGADTIFMPSQIAQGVTSGLFWALVNYSSPPIQCIAGDYFENILLYSTGFPTPMTVSTNFYFAMELLN